MKILYIIVLIFLAQETFGQFGQFNQQVLQTPAVGNKGNPCYDQFRRPQRCIPPFENAAFELPIEATNTCGDVEPQEYCVQTGVTTIRKSCDMCYAGQHSSRFLTDLHNIDNPSWWQSETLLEGVTQVNLTLKFGKAFDITYIRLWFNSPRPESFYLSKRVSFDGPWIPYQYYSASCRDTYGLPDNLIPTVLREETRALCTSEYSDISPLRDGNVAFGTLEARPSAQNFDNSSELQEWVTATEIMVTLDRINTFGDEVFGDPQVLRSYFYAISDISVGARCKCNGHASECVASNGPNGFHTRVCRCEHNTAGPDCGECLPFYNDAPWARANTQDAHECKECNCNNFSNRCIFDQKLYEETGHGGHCLDCAANRDGANCEKCRPNYYMMEDGTCVSCDCDATGSLFQQCNSQGKCQCKPGVTGEKCDRCAENHFDFTKNGCKSCNCYVPGSGDNTPRCHSFTGECLCKENVEGEQCSECKPGFFNLDIDNAFGCTPCFCYGHASKCRSAAGYSKYAIESTFSKGHERWHVELPNGTITLPKYDRISQSIGAQTDQDDRIYFVAPDRYLGDQRASYNQILEFSLKIENNRNHYPSAADIILESNNKRITINVFGQSNPMPTSQFQTYKFRLHEDSRYVWQPRLTSRDFISLLSNLTAIKIRATYTIPGVGYLEDVKLETAARGTAGEPALWMEFCECPIGYVGQFCDSCAPGYRHSPAHGGPFTSCIPCDCNGHADICEAETGKCICQHNTSGENCEFCARGFYGNALAGTPSDCLPCNCPEGGACIQVDEDVVCIECPTGYSGPKCEICSDGYFGNPCEVCVCNDNIDTNAVGNCDTVTGECLKCIHNTGGARCEVCLPGFYGNALVLPKGNCRRCECYPLGTQSDNNTEAICDQTTGVCSCKSHVIGRNCDQCEDGYYNIGSNTGCENCNCDPVGSYNQTCDVYTGQCYCRPGVVGLRCDACEVRKYGFSYEGCKDCDCDVTGSTALQCDASGQCPCRENVEGRRCDRCKENKYDRHRGCLDCPHCYSLVQNAHQSHKNKLAELNDILSSIESRPTVIRDDDFPVELEKLQDDIDQFHDKVKEATGNDSVIYLVDDIKTRAGNINRTLETVNENIAVAEIYGLDAATNNENSDEVLKTLEDYLNDITTSFENEARAALQKAEKNNQQVGQQSQKMTNISQQARELADKLDDQAEALVDRAKQAKRKSDEVFEQANKTIANQDDIANQAQLLKTDIYNAERKLNKTKELTEEVNNKTSIVKAESARLLSEVNSLVIPTVDIPALEKRSGHVKEESELLHRRIESLLQNNDELDKNINDKSEKASELLLEAEEQQNESSGLLTEVYDTRADINKTITTWNKYFNDAETIYRDLKDFDIMTNKSKEEALEALRTVPVIEATIDGAEKRRLEAQGELQGSKEIAEASERKTADAKKLGTNASVELKGLLEKAKELDNNGTLLIEETTTMQGEVDDTQTRLNDLLNHNRFNSTLMLKAKEKVGKADKDTEAVSGKVDKLLEDVQEIISELQSTPRINDTELGYLEKEIQVIELHISEKGLDEKLTKLKHEHKNQEMRIEDYKQKIRDLQRDVDNIEQIVKSLPDGCFRKVVLEP